MFIHWRVHRVEEVVGSVADFCPICRALRAFRFVKVERVSEILFVPLSRTALGRFVRCLACEATLAADDSQYAAFAGAKEDDLETLIATTRPGLRAERAERLALEERLRRSPDGLAPAQRADLLFEPFEALEAMVRSRLKEGIRFDAYSGLGCGGAVAALVAGPWMARKLPAPWQWLVGPVLGLAIALGAYTLFEFFRNPGRAAGKRVLPLLARALAPLQPLQEELALCIYHCRNERWKIGRLVRIGRLRAELQAVSAAPPRSSPRDAAARPGS